METLKSSNKTIEHIKRDLASPSEATVIGALRQCRESGNASLVEPLLELFATTQSDLVKREVREQLSTLKVSGTAETFMRALNNPEWRTLRKDMLGFMWSSNVQAENHLTELVKMAIEGSFEEALECHTLVEYMDGRFPDSQVIQSAQLLERHLAQASDNPHKLIMVQLNDFMKSLVQP